MSAKERFLKKLQDQKNRNAAFGNKAEADISMFNQRMCQLQEDIESWLTGTGISVSSYPVSLIELLAGGVTFSVPAINVRYVDRSVTFTPVFLYGQGVTGCIEVSLCIDSKSTPKYRMFARDGGGEQWTYSVSGKAESTRRSFSEEIFFEMIDELLQA